MSIHRYHFPLGFQASTFYSVHAWAPCLYCSCADIVKNFFHRRENIQNYSGFEESSATNSKQKPTPSAKSGVADDSNLTIEMGFEKSHSVKLESREECQSLEINSSKHEVIIELDAKNSEYKECQLVPEVNSEKHEIVMEIDADSSEEESSDEEEECPNVFTIKYGNVHVAMKYEEDESEKDSSEEENVEELSESDDADEEDEKDEEEEIVINDYESDSDDDVLFVPEGVDIDCGNEEMGSTKEHVASKVTFNLTPIIHMIEKSEFELKAESDDLDYAWNNIRASYKPTKEEMAAKEQRNKMDLLLY